LPPLAARFPRLALVWVDRGDTGPTFADGVAAALGWRVAVVPHPAAGPTPRWRPAGAPPPPPRPAGCRLPPRRWVVERTVAWRSRCRRLAKDDEGLGATGEAWSNLAMIRLLARRLAP